MFFGDECFHFRRSGVRLDQCSCVSAFVVGLIIFGSYFCGGLPARLLWPSLRPRVCESSSLSNWSFPFGVPSSIAFVPQLEAPSESITHSIPRSFLVVFLSAYAVGLADTLWLCPERALCLFFASVSLVDPVALSPLSRSVFADGFCLL